MAEIYVPFTYNELDFLYEAVEYYSRNVPTSQAEERLKTRLFEKLEQLERYATDE